MQGQEEQTSRVSYIYAMISIALTFTDSEEQKKEWRENPDKHDQYSRDVEGELNKRFTLVCLVVAIS